VIATVNAGTEIAEAISTFGVITPPGDAVAFAHAIETLAENSHERLRLGAAARLYALRNFDKNRILAAFGKSLQNLNGVVPISETSG
jgi:colanic acid biosynthesis glycosyl transferase WcaI